MLSEKIASKIIAEIREMIKDFVSNTIADRSQCIKNLLLQTSALCGIICDTYMKLYGI